MATPFVLPAGFGAAGSHGIRERFLVPLNGPNWCHVDPMLSLVGSLFLTQRY
ncbi:MAG: hypothetical protein JNL80_12860 [Phycisphaerae bacterium]|nr:hypothetical protein [Phycisphaerae bacterium]